MQPFGPDPRVMIVPEGEQAAGYAVVRVCFGHRLLYNQGRPLRFGHGRGERREVWVVQGGERERVLGLGDLTVVDSETARWPLERRDG